MVKLIDKKYSTKQSQEELEEYLNDLELRKTPKNWEVELAEVLKTYLEMIGA